MEDLWGMRFVYNLSDHNGEVKKENLECMAQLPL